VQHTTNHTRVTECIAGSIQAEIRVGLSAHGDAWHFSGAAQSASELAAGALTPITTGGLGSVTQISRRLRVMVER